MPQELDASSPLVIVARPAAPEYLGGPASKSDQLACTVTLAAIVLTDRQCARRRSTIYETGSRNHGAVCVGIEPEFGGRLSVQALAAVQAEGLRFVGGPAFLQSRHDE